MSYFAGHIASGLLAATWTVVWHWGAGVGLIILLLAAAYFSPFAKRYFVYAAVVVAAVMTIYGFGLTDEKKICAAQTKYVYLHTHTPVQDKLFLSPSAPAPRQCGELEWGCWQQQ